MSGVGENRFNPGETAARAEAETILRNLVEEIIGGHEIDGVRK